MNPINWDEYKNLQDQQVDEVNRLEGKDVVAMSIAMLQLVLPIALAFMGVTFVFILLFKWFFI